MGGVGSGRYEGTGDKGLTTSMLRLDIREVARKGWLNSWLPFSWQWSRNGEPVGNITIAPEEGALRLRYRTRRPGEGWRDHNYPVRLLPQQMPFGGSRAWFACPARGCGKRVAILYGGEVFACRACHRLAYPSQHDGPEDRPFARAQRLRAKLGWEPGFDAAFGRKPKHMHHATFAKLVAQLDHAETASCAAMVRKVDRLRARLSD
ncbi:MAG: hypothetical protein ACU0DW_12680 [Shimia sp.]